MNSSAKTLVVMLCAGLLLTACSDRLPADGGESTPPSSDPSLTPPETSPSPAPDPNANFPGLELTWTETTPSPVALYESQGLTANGLLYVFGGFYNDQIQSTNRSYAFNPATAQWLQLAPMPEEVTHAGQALYNERVYLAGGFLGDHPGPPTNHVWIYDIKKDRWSAGPELPERLGGGALVELEGKLHFFGGTFRKGDVYTRDSAKHWVFDLTDPHSVWTEATPLPTPRNHLAGVSVGGKIYAIGGQTLGDEDNGNSQVVEAYDPEHDSWEEVASLPRPLGHISAGTFSYEGRIIVVMGVTNGRDKLSDVIAYNPKTDVWDNLTSMPGGRSATVSGIIDEKIVLATGTVAGGPLDTTWIGTWDKE